MTTPTTRPGQDLTDFLDSCTQQDMRYMLSYLSGYSPECFAALKALHSDSPDLLR